MRRALCCAIAVLVWAINAYADGVYIYRAKPPAIPSQRAIIVHKDGIERLQVESLVQSEGDSLAWILPVPATPTDIKEVSPGFLKTLALNAGPSFDGGRKFEVHHSYALLAAVFIGGWALFALFAAPGRQALPAMTIIAASIVVLATAGAYLSLRVQYAGGMSGSAVRVEKASVIGNYEVRVLDAPDAAALDAWLAQNGFAALPEKGKAIAAEYIKEGWRFVTAKLRTEAGQLLRPHPLELSFATEHAVYPMRLTALAECDVFLDLFVIANQAAGADGLTVEYIDRVRRMTAQPADETGFEPKASLTWASIDHPATANYLWQGCAVTRLEGTLSPAQMDKDILFDFSDAASIRKTYLTFKDKSLLARTWAYGIGILVLTMLTLAATFKETEQLRSKATRVGAAVAVLAGTAAWGVCEIVLPAKDVILVGGGGDRLENHHMQSLDIRFGLPQLDFGSAIPGLEKLPTSELASVVHAYFTYVPVFNWSTRERIILEDSPGNLLIENEDDRVVIKAFSDNGKSYSADVREILESERRGYGETTLTFPGTADAPGLEKVFREWRESPHHGYGTPTYLTVMYAIARDPQGLAGPSIRVIEDYCDRQVMPGYVLEVAVGGLGLATKTVPPADLADRAALKAFLVEVQSRLKSQAANPGA